MYKINYLMLTGFFIASIMVISFSSVFEKDVFAIEYNTYTSSALGIEFQYPSDWKVEEEDNGINISRDDEINSSPIIIQDLGEQGEHNLKTFTNEWFATVLDLFSGDQIKIIENPITISTGNLEIGTFLITYQSWKDDSDTMAAQNWTFIANEHVYSIQLSTSINTFNSIENTEILDHFIKSVKIISNDET
jgi:hypothetical protein